MATLVVAVMAAPVVTAAVKQHLSLVFPVIFGRTYISVSYYGIHREHA